MAKNKVEIIIEKMENYTSVGFMANRYGMGYPCNSEEDIKEGIKHAKEWILREGDKPIVVDKRDGHGQLKLGVF